MSQALIHECVGNGGIGVCSIRFFGEALEKGLQENGRYEYELDTPGVSLREVPGVIRHSSGLVLPLRMRDMFQLRASGVRESGIPEEYHAFRGPATGTPRQNHRDFDRMNGMNGMGLRGRG